MLREVSPAAAAEGVVKFSVMCKTPLFRGIFEGLREGGERCAISHSIGG